MNPSVVFVVAFEYNSAVKKSEIMAGRTFQSFLHILVLVCVLNAILFISAEAKVSSRKNKRVDNIFAPKWNLSPNRRCKLNDDALNGFQ